MPHSPPSNIGRYEILREPGRGMMGIVYEALDPALDRRIALKTIQLAFTLPEGDRTTSGAVRPDAEQSLAGA